MKKLILSVSLVLMSLNGYAQTTSPGSGSSVIDTSNNPSGVGFGGVTNGANNTSPATTTTPGTSTVPGRGNGTGTSTVPAPTTLPQQQEESILRGDTFEEQEERGNFAGGALGGQTGSGATTTPSNSTVPETRPRNIPSPTGLGTGAPTTY